MRLTLHQRQIIWAYLFMSVALVFFVVIRWYPTILAFNVSFRDWNVFEGSGPWVGIENYQEIWQDAGKPRSSVTAAFSNTVRYVLFGVPTQLVLALGIALLLAQIQRFAALFRVAYFAPYVTSAVAVAFVWNWLYQPETGLLNQALDLVGLPQQPFTKSPHKRCRRSPRLLCGRIWAFPSSSSWPVSGRFRVCITKPPVLTGQILGISSGVSPCPSSILSSSI